MDYNKLLEKARKVYAECVTNAEKRKLESVFPELAQSEDERIRKELLEHCINRRDGKQVCVDASDYRRWADWLEKHGNYYRLVEEIKERKELLSKEKEKATSTNDKLSLGGRIAILEELLAFTKEKQDEQKPVDSYCKENCKGYQETGKCFADGGCKAKRDAEHNPAWSEEDEEMILDTIKAFQLAYPYATEEENPRKRNIDWLKSLKPQPHWKPTEEQLMALRDAIDNNEMESLYNDLKKL